MIRINCMVLAAVFMLATAVVKADQCASSGECPGGDMPNNVVSVLQTQLHMNALEGKGGQEEMAAAQKKAAERGIQVEGALVKGLAKAASGTASCTKLLNKQTHFAVEVAVGTPPQHFELVADTGSDAVIVASCVCVGAGGCVQEDHCFAGTNHSSTFEVVKDQNDQLQAIKMTFGSGPLEAVVATDVVEIGGISATMTAGLLLMVDRSDLEISGPFEGILGLGPPKNAAGGNANLGQGVMMVAGGTNPPPAFETKRWLKEAAVERFSICFNDGAADGVLRMNGPAFQNPIPSIGTAHHWALTLNGISVGNETAPALLCSGSDATAGSSTDSDEETGSPCGAIPDSGTTLLTGPADHVDALKASLCQSWPRCQARQLSSGALETDALAFEWLVNKCNVWMTNETGIDEIPSIFFDVGSPASQKLEVTAWAYIVEQEQEAVETEIQYVGGVIPVQVSRRTGKTQKVCSARIGADDMFSVDNGPVWLLGTPLFFQYVVGYDMEVSQMEFRKGDCTECAAAPALFGSEEKLVHKGRRPRAATEPARKRKMDKSLGL